MLISSLELKIGNYQFLSDKGFTQSYGSKYNEAINYVIHDNTLNMYRHFVYGDSNSNFHYTSYTVGTVLTRNTDTRPMPM